MTEQKRYKELYKNIIFEKGKPFNHWEITALLETYGLRDIDAKNEYNSENLFELAKKLEVFIEHFDYDEKPISVEEIIPIVPRITKNYIKGLAFALPMLIQITATIFIGYSLWSSTEISVADATGIAIGSFTALMVTGGIAQIIGRQGIYYIKVEQHMLAAKIIKKLYIFGFKIIFFVAILLSVTHLLFGFFPLDMYLLAISFYIMLSVLYLSFSIYYALEDFIDIVSFTLGGVILVFVLYRLLEFELVISQIIGLGILNIIIYIYSNIKLNKLEQFNPEAEDAILPKTVVLFHTLLPFFLYGFFYFSFLVADRYIAWSADYENNPYIIWFNINYELGLDWALISLVFMVGVTEVSISEVLIRINRATKDYKYNEVDSYNKMIINYINKFNIVFLIVAVIVVFLSFFIIYYLSIIFNNESLSNMLIEPIPTLFGVASLAYLFLVKALMNVLLIFSFSRERYATTAIFYGVIVNVLTGLILSRLLGYEYTVIGLLAGAVVFWYFSNKGLKKIINNLDYYYYSAYF